MVAGWLLIAVHFLIFVQFLPNAQGTLGNDYAYKFPLLLDGYYWFINNGLFSRPLFTPSFCGGLPRLANPQAVYVSALQFFTFFTDPLNSTRLTFLLFATLGFWGFYLLLRHRFAVQPWTALLGGTLFLFNGFYAWRFVIGHAEFHSFMLVPLLAFFLLPTSQPRPSQVSGATLAEREEAAASGGEGADPLRRWRSGRNLVAGAMLMGYMLWGAMIQLFLPSLLAVVAIALVHHLCTEVRGGLRVFLTRFTLAGVLALLLTASKLVATQAFLHNFPREGYALPGVAGVFKLLGLVGEALFLGGGQVNADDIVAHAQWVMQRHEFEYGVTIVPFLLIAVHLLTRLTRSDGDQGPATRFTPGQTVTLAGLQLLLLLPLALNYYSPDWNHFLKTLPVIRQLSNVFRWFVIYIPFLVLMAALAMERTGLLRRYHLQVIALALTLIIGQNLITDTAYYEDQVYAPDTILAAYDAARESGTTPSIEYMVTSQDETGTPRPSLDGNDALVDGGSQLLCYEPIFGYRLENLPFKTIHPGPALVDEGGFLNLKNPACYLYPKENNCEPGDHFLASQLKEAEVFINFQPFAYNKSQAQEVADDITLVTIILLLLLSCLYGVIALRARLRPPPAGERTDSPPNPSSPHEPPPAEP